MLRGLLAVSLLAMAGCAGLMPVHDVNQTAFVGQAPMAQRALQIKRAGASLGWIMVEERPGVIRGTLNLRTHQAVVDVPYDRTAYSIRYVSSSDLNYTPAGTYEGHSAPMIHRNYNGWIENLDHRIAAESSI